MEGLDFEIAFTPEDYKDMLEKELGNDIRILDIRNKSFDMDYLILATMHSGRHRKAAAQYIYLQV